MGNIFESYRDDYTFPTTSQGLRQMGMVEEKVEEVKEPEKVIFESAVDVSYDTYTRSDAIAAVLSWRDEGEYTYDAMAAAISEVADIDYDGEISDDEEETYNELWGIAADAMAYLGAKQEDIVAFYGGPSEEADKAGERIAKQIKDELEGMTDSDDDLIMAFAMGSQNIVTENAESLDAIYEFALGKLMKRVVHGVVKRTRKSLKKGYKMVAGKMKKMTAKMRLAVKKMLKKAHNGMANLRRKKSMRKRQSMGLDK